ncbi:MAG: hypothetical protein ACI9W2_003241 [Gammaproteobacteria bacterium]|jgi:hypothetical protein
MFAVAVWHWADRLLVAFSAIAPASLYLPHPCGRVASAVGGARRAHFGVWSRVARIWSTTFSRRRPIGRHGGQSVLSFLWPLRKLFAAQPQWLSRVLGVVIRTLSTALLKRAGLRHCDGARTGMVTYVQRFGSKLNLSVHLHVLALDGGYSFEHGKVRFHCAGALHPEELQALLSTVITRVTSTLVAASGILPRAAFVLPCASRAGVLMAEDEQPYLDLAMDSPYEQLAGAAIRYVIAAGPQTGRATMRLRDPLLAVGASGARTKPFNAARDGFSLNCAVGCEVHERAKLERLCCPRK